MTCSECCNNCWKCYEFYPNWPCYYETTPKCNCGQLEDGNEKLFSLRSEFEFWFEIDEESFEQRSRPDAPQDILDVVEDFKRELSNGYTWVALPSNGEWGSNVFLGAGISNEETTVFVPAGTNVRPEDASGDWMYGAQTSVHGSAAGQRTTIATSFAKSCFTRFGGAAEFRGIGFDGYMYAPYGTQDSISGARRVGYGFILYPNSTMHLGAVVVTNTGEWRPGEPLGYVCNMRAYPHVYTQKCQLILEGYTEREATPEDYYSVGGKVIESYQFLVDGVLKFKSMYDFYTTDNPTGSCCLPNGDCSVTTAEDCSEKCGVWTAEATCDSNPCPAQEPSETKCFESPPENIGGIWIPKDDKCHSTEDACSDTCNCWKCWHLYPDDCCQFIEQYGVGRTAGHLYSDEYLPGYDHHTWPSGSDATGTLRITGDFDSYATHIDGTTMTGNKVNPGGGNACDGRSANLKFKPFSDELLETPTSPTRTYDPDTFTRYLYVDFNYSRSFPSLRVHVEPDRLLVMDDYFAKVVMKIQKIEYGGVAIDRQLFSSPSGTLDAILYADVGERPEVNEWVTPIKAVPQEDWNNGTLKITWRHQVYKKYRNSNEFVLDAQLDGVTNLWWPEMTNISECIPVAERNSNDLIDTRCDDKQPDSRNWLPSGESGDCQTRTQCIQSDCVTYKCWEITSNTGGVSRKCSPRNPWPDYSGSVSVSGEYNTLGECEDNCQNRKCYKRLKIRPYNCITYRYGGGVLNAIPQSCGSPTVTGSIVGLPVEEYEFLNFGRNCDGVYIPDGKTSPENHQYRYQVDDSPELGMPVGSVFQRTAPDSCSFNYMSTAFSGSAMFGGESRSGTNITIDVPSYRSRITHGGFGRPTGNFYISAGGVVNAKQRYFRGATQFSGGGNVTCPEVLQGGGDEVWIDTLLYITFATDDLYMQQAWCTCDECYGVFPLYQAMRYGSTLSRVKVAHLHVNVTFPNDTTIIEDGPDIEYKCQPLDSDTPLSDLLPEAGWGYWTLENDISLCEDCTDPRPPACTFTNSEGETVEVQMPSTITTTYNFSIEFGDDVDEGMQSAFSDMIERLNEKASGTGDLEYSEPDMGLAGFNSEYRDEDEPNDYFLQHWSASFSDAYCSRIVTSLAGGNPVSGLSIPNPQYGIIHDAPESFEVVQVGVKSTVQPPGWYQHPQLIVPKLDFSRYVDDVPQFFLDGGTITETWKNGEATGNPLDSAQSTMLVYNYRNAYGNTLQGSPDAVLTVTRTITIPPAENTGTSSSSSGSGSSSGDGNPYP